MGTEDVGTGLADVGHIRKQEILNVTSSSILCLYFLSHRDGWLVWVGTLGAVLCHLLQRNPDSPASMW
jgi:hypothetical protein